MNYSNNLFCYATSELSQDAFICWLLSFLLEENKGTDLALEKCASEFVRCFYPEFPENGMVTNVQRQYKNIDVLLSIGDKKIIIEDKTFTGVHGNQINVYKKTLAEEGISENDIVCVYYKIIEQPNAEPGVDYEFTREKLIELFRKHMNDNVIFQNYLEHLENIDKRVMMFKELPTDQWDGYAYKGFFSSLRPGVFKRDASWWRYVSNPTGGFMCLWWSGADKNTLDSTGLSKVVRELYPQIENNKMAIKITTNEDAPKEAIKSVRQKLYHYFTDKLNGEFNRIRFHNGQHLTVGYTLYDYQNHLIKINQINTAIKELGTDFRL